MGETWMIYGATGFTGELIIQEAINKGHHPIIAGRNSEKIYKLASEYKLPYRIFPLDNIAEVAKNISDVHLVLHCAGPFVETFQPMVTACLQSRVHYLDITGEIPVFEEQFSLHEKAISSEILILSGVGFDVVPTDCLARHVAELLPDAVSLDIAFAGISQMSPGTAKSMVEAIPRGGLVRRNHKLEFYPLGKGSRRQKFSKMGELTIVPIPWGDLSTAYRSTQIPNITTYAVYPDWMVNMIGLFEPVIRNSFSLDWVRGAVKSIIDHTIKGPQEEMRQNGMSCIYAKVTNHQGVSKEAWLETLEGYLFTAKASVLSVEKVLKGKYSGALTPSLAFGKDFILEIPGTEILEALS